MTLTDLLDEYGANALNRVTRYPSIETYHVLSNGCLTAEIRDSESWEDCAYVYEKIDGSNFRIIVLNGDYLIGSRKDLVYAKGDRIPNINISSSAMHIMIKEAEALAKQLQPGYLYVMYGELYGGNITRGSGSYTKNKNSYAYRAFDLIQVDAQTLISVIEGGGDRDWKTFLSVNEFEAMCDLLSVKTAPKLGCLNQQDLPISIKHTYEWLKLFEKTKSGIDVHGKVEGVIVRNEDRSFIRKIRFDDYERAKNKGVF